MTIWSRASSEDECIGISFYGSVEPRVHAINIYTLYLHTMLIDLPFYLINRLVGEWENFLLYFAIRYTLYWQIFHIFMKNSENRIWVMYNIKVQCVQVTESCSVYLPRKIEIRRSYMRSNRLYMLLILALPAPPEEIANNFFNLNNPPPPMPMPPRPPLGLPPRGPPMVPFGLIRGPPPPGMY